MSKEQTYITAEDYINSQDNFLGRDWRNDDKELAKAFKEFSKHNEETKVLEALERHCKEVEVLCRNAHLLGMKETLPGYPKPETIDEFIQTEVKPKYIQG